MSNFTDIATTNPNFYTYNKFSKLSRVEPASSILHLGLFDAPVANIFDNQVVNVRSDVNFEESCTRIDFDQKRLRQFEASPNAIC